jgi:hypothetical protein
MTFKESERFVKSLSCALSARIVLQGGSTSPQSGFCFNLASIFKSPGGAQGGTVEQKSRPGNLKRGKEGAVDRVE